MLATIFLNAESCAKRKTHEQNIPQTEVAYLRRGVSLE